MFEVHIFFPGTLRVLPFAVCLNRFGVKMFVILNFIYPALS